MSCVLAYILQLDETSWHCNQSDIIPQFVESMKHITLTLQMFNLRAYIFDIELNALNYTNKHNTNLCQNIE